jgi:hypothetical protein
MFHQTEAFYGVHNFKLFFLFILQIFFWFHQTKEPEERDYFLAHNIKLFLFFIRQLFFRFHQTKEPVESDYFLAHSIKLLLLFTLQLFSGFTRPRILRRGIISGLTSSSSKDIHSPAAERRPLEQDSWYQHLFINYYNKISR